MQDFAKALIFMGFVFVGAGLFIAFAGKTAGIGRLPGDIYIKKGSFVFYFPLMTCFAVSLFLTAVFSLFGRK